jgi:hypothetical protein
MIRELLEHRNEADLRRARQALSELFHAPGDADARAHHARIALIGLRGAGKSVAGPTSGGRSGLRLHRAEPRDRAVRRLQHPARSTTCTARNAYRRYERRALEEAIQIYPEVVIATPGGLVSDSRPTSTCMLSALLHHLAAGRPGRPHVARGGAGRHPPHGRQPRGHGRPQAHPGRPRGVLRQGRPGASTPAQYTLEDCFAAPASCKRARNWRCRPDAACRFELEACIKVHLTLPDLHALLFI